MINDVESEQYTLLRTDEKFNTSDEAWFFIETHLKNAPFDYQVLSKNNQFYIWYCLKE